MSVNFLDSVTSDDFAARRVSQIRTIAACASAATTDEQLALIRRLPGYESCERRQSVGVYHMVELYADDNIGCRLTTIYGRDGATGRLTFPEGAGSAEAFQVATSCEQAVAKLGVSRDVWLERVGQDIDVAAHVGEDGTIKGEGLEEILAHVHTLGVLLRDRYDWVFAADEGEEPTSFTLEEYGAPYELAQYAQMALLSDGELTNFMKSVDVERKYAGMERYVYERRFMDSVEDVAVPWGQVLAHYGLDLA